jgi:predicted nuclease of restriction endonuclease-like (RecB) superfamily
MAKEGGDVAGAEYRALLDALKQRVMEARDRAALAANRELLLLYWGIGREILARQDAVGWGGKVIGRLSRDLRHAFPEMKGLSPRNLTYMRAMAEAWPEAGTVEKSIAPVPWGHVVRILDKVREPPARMFYLEQTAAYGWSREVLMTHLSRRLHERQGRAVTNFGKTLPAQRRDVAAQILKDPYVFDFLGLTEEAEERDIERGLVRHIRNTLLEMGVGFAFVGNQVRIEVAGREFFLDVLFYHVRLHCYVVVELKGGEFLPEHAGKLNFYLSAVDEQMRAPEIDGPTIGLLLCRSKNQLMVEYALRDIRKPIGVAHVELTRLLPKELKTSLPTVEALEAELSDFPATADDEA